jgi:peptide/nickel transport system substrate-binding protein
VARIREVVRSVGAMALAGVLVSLSACTAEPEGGGPGAATRRQTVRVVLTQDPPSLSLLGKANQTTEILAAQITDSLVQYDEHLELQPRVARSWEISADGLTLTFHLRSGVRWHDGRPVRAADVIHSFELARDPAVENRSSGSQMQDVAAITAPDESTVQIRYGHPVVDFLDPWRMPLVPAHLAERGAELLTGKFAEHPVGCGPFRFVAYKPGQEIVLEANADYWDGRPAIDRLVFSIYPDQRTSAQALLRGDVDVMVVSSDVWSEARKNPRLAGEISYRLAVYQVLWNMDGTNPYFLDPRVRRALILALDRQQFADTVAQGLAMPAATSFHPGLHAWTDPEVRPLPFDPGEARRLLDEAGWTDADRDGVRERGGRAFEFTLLTSAGAQALAEQIAAWLQHGWAAIGVRARIERIEWNAFRERRDAHRFEAATTAFSFTPSPDQFELYHSSASSWGNNYGSFADSEVDQLLETGRTAKDPAERRAIYYRLQRRLLEQQPIGWLWHFATPLLHDARLQGVAPTPLDYLRTTAGPRLWHWSDTPEQR